MIVSDSSFRRGAKVGSFRVLALLAALCGLLEGWWRPPISLVPDSSKEGLSRAEGELCYPLPSQSSEREGVDCDGET